MKETRYRAILKALTVALAPTVFALFVLVFLSTTPQAATAVSNHGPESKAKQFRVPPPRVVVLCACLKFVLGFVFVRRVVGIFVWTFVVPDCGRK